MFETFIKLYNDQDIQLIFFKDETVDFVLWFLPELEVQCLEFEWQLQCRKQSLESETAVSRILLFFIQIHQIDNIPNLLNIHTLKRLISDDAVTSSNTIDSFVSTREFFKSGHVLRTRNQPIPM